MKMTRPSLRRMRGNNRKKNLQKEYVSDLVGVENAVKGSSGLKYAL